MTTPSTSPSEGATDVSDESFEIIDVSNESLCSVSAESCLSLPEEALALSIDELKNAIANCESLILSKPEDAEERKWLVRRLIELRLRLQNIKEQDEENVSKNKINESSKVILGHHFTLQLIPIPSSDYYCDRCSCLILGILHKWYLCKDCDYKCHFRCLSYVCRVCAHVIVSENPDFVREICPEAEDGLANQNYRCVECLAHISFKNNTSAPRLCDYTGKYYCSTCHWNSTSVIPARVIHNWDFKERFVSRSSKQILKLMAKLPILKLEELNPVLFACIEELVSVKELRQQLMQLKKYLTSCKSAVEGQLLWQASGKVHFLENEDNYSLQDLIDLKSGELINYLNKIIFSLIKHVQEECEVCKGRGFFCELCKDEKVIFPFEKNVVSCSKCQSTFHFFCWVKNNENCPKCNRIQQRLLKSQTDGMPSVFDS